MKYKLMQKGRYRSRLKGRLIKIVMRKAPNGSGALQTQGLTGKVCELV